MALSVAALALCLLALPPDGRAEEAGGRALIKIPLGDLEAVPPPPGSQSGRQRPTAPEKTEPPLPPESATRHSVAFAGRTLAFTAKVGAVVFEDPPGVAVAEIGYVAYLLDGTAPAKRPVTFVLNGGPGSASAWLHLGTLGPWRLPMTLEAARPTASAALLPNAETWLDFTDLVFIDPVGTGYSRLHHKDKAVKEKFWSVQGDISSITLFIKRWAEANGRLESPKLIVGESYGGFRAPRLAQALQAMPGMAPNGIVMISPALSAPTADFPGLGNALTRTVLFPSLAAAIADGKGPVTGEQLAAFEREAVNGYLPDMLAGPRDKVAVERLAGRIASVTGLDIETVRLLGPRSSPQTFLSAIDHRSGRTANTYDATEKRVAAYDGPNLVDSGDDLGALSLQLARAMDGLVQGPLEWRPQREYQVRGQGAGWNWSGYESVTALRSALVRDATFRAVIVHGYADLVTPYFRNKLIIEQMPTIGDDLGRMRLEVHGGGHMLYTRDDSRVLLRKDGLRLFEEIGAVGPGR